MGDGYLVHMTDCWKLPDILRSGEIIGAPFVSFSKGLPDVFSHGRVAIVFSRHCLESKGYTFIDVGYTREFFESHPSIAKHVLGDISINKLFMYRVQWAELMLEANRNHDIKCSVDTIVESVKAVSKSKAELKRKPSIDLTSFKFEQEVICTNNLSFELDDVLGIVHLSRTFENEFKCPSKWDKVVWYAEDYCDIVFNAQSETLRLYSRKFKCSREGLNSISVSSGTVPMYFVPYLHIIRPELRSDVMHSVGGVVKLPNTVLDMVKNLSITYMNPLQELIEHYIYYSYILDKGADVKYENFLYEKFRQLKSMT